MARRNMCDLYHPQRDKDSLLYKKMGREFEWYEMGHVKNNAKVVALFLRLRFLFLF